jgi:hypothetical protein
MEYLQKPPARVKNSLFYLSGMADSMGGGGCVVAEHYPRQF